MKRFITSILSLFIVCSSFAATLYVSTENFEADYPMTSKKLLKEWDKSFINIQAQGKKQGIDVIDINSLPLAKEYSYWGQIRSEKDDISDKIKTLKKQKKNLEKELEQSKSMGFKMISIDGKSPEEAMADYTQKIEQAQTELDNYDKTHIDRKTCVPLISFKLEYRDSWDGISYELESTFTNKDGTQFESKCSLPKDTVNTDLQTLMEKYVEAFFPFTEKVEQSNPPLLVDSKVLNITKSFSYTPVSIAPKEDFSFTLREGDVITDYSPTWDEKSSINKRIATVNPDKEWVLSTNSDNTVSIGNLSYPSVYKFDSDSNLVGTTMYQFPKSNYGLLRFFSTGRPYIVEMYPNLVIYLPEKNNAAKKFLFPISAPTSILSGPDETFWFGGKGTIFVYNTDNSLKEIIQIPINQDSQVQKVLPDGSFICKTATTLSRHKHNGQIMWTKDLEESMTYVGIAGAANGIYYLYNSPEKTLIRLAEADAKLPPVLASLMKINDDKKNDSLVERAKNYLTIANTYFENKSYSSALENYNLYLQISPADSSASDKKIFCEIAINKKTAAESYEKTLNLFDEYGEETAKAEYQKTMLLLEKLKKQAPWDMEIQEMYAELKNTFSTDGSFVQAKAQSIEVLEVDLNSLFPALITVYASNSSGNIKIKNNSSNPIKNISVTSYIRKYMDFPCKGEVLSELPANEDTYISINTILNKNVLALNEATPVQVQFTINWEENGKAFSSVITRPLTIYKKSALTWADTAMVACFVQPNDPTVADFIFKAMDNPIDTVISTNITKAIKLSDAVGSIPLNYVSDPVTPITQVIDNEYAVDTVRFPSETLRLKGGDCDDMTTLFCSLMEGSGINSALITTAGHIFAAFDTGLAYGPIWENLGDEYLIIEVDGKAWIPIETTILPEGFTTAWRTASKEIGKEEYEVTTLASSWEIYSSVPSDTTKSDIALNSKNLSSMNVSERTKVINAVSDSLARIDLQSASIQNLNSIAKIYHSMGNDAKAIEVLSVATGKDQTYRQGFANLATLYEATGDKQKAKDFRDRANNLRASEAAKSDSKSRASNAGSDDWAD